MQITLEPLCSDPCARLKIQIPMHSISWSCPKIVRHCDPISLVINTFGINLEPECKSHEQIIHYRTDKNVQKQATVLLYFSTNSYKLTRKGFPVVWLVNTENIFFFLFTTKCRFLTFSAFLTSVWSVIRVWVPYVQRYSLFQNTHPQPKDAKETHPPLWTQTNLEP